MGKVKNKGFKSKKKLIASNKARSLYSEKYDKIAFSFCKSYGGTNEQLGKLLGVSSMTIINWFEEHESFRHAVRDGKDIYDTAIVEASLQKRANGMTITEKTVEEVFDAAGNQIGLAKTKTSIKELAPDVIACIFWLKNRNQARWRDRVEQMVEIENVQDEEKLREIMKRLHGAGNKDGT